MLCKHTWRRAEAGVKVHSLSARWTLSVDGRTVRKFGLLTEDGHRLSCASAFAIVSIFSSLMSAKT